MDMKNKQMIKSFTDAKNNLNPEQAKAVTKIYGATLAVAGPGTGKTECLALTVGEKLISEAQVNPNTILCLTYTDAGAVAMRKRLIQYFGTEAYKVHIYTFHSFCNDLVQRYPDYFGKRQVEPVSELEQIDIIHGIIDELPTNSPITRLKGDPYYEVKRLKNLFGKMKDENWMPETIEKAASEYIKDLPMREEFIYKRGNAKKNIKAGDVKKHLVEQEKEKMKKLVYAANLITEYNGRLEEMGRYDFSDMIHWVLHRFSTDNHFLLSQQEKFQFVLVDEFQDTSGAQNLLLDRLLSFWPDPNIFVVADEDQCLYEFNGARIHNIMEFEKKYHPEVVVLQKNYRSIQHILSSAKRVIDNNVMRLVGQLPGLEKNLVSARKDLSQDLQPEVREFPNIFAEEQDVVNQVMDLIAQGESMSEIAVLYRKHRQGENIIRELQYRAIPLNVKRSVSILDEVIVNQVLDILRYLVLMTRGEGSRVQNVNEAWKILFRILHFRFWGLKRGSTEKLFISKDLKNEVFSDCGWALEILDLLVEDYHNLKLVQVLERILRNTGMLGWIVKLDDKNQQLLILHSFFSWVKSEIFKDTTLDGERLMAKIDRMRQHEVRLSVEDINYETEGVTVGTCHGSKGLEWKHVFLIGCTRDQWEKSRAGSLSYSLPDTLTYSTDENKIESNRRLFYVAMTRAKESLIVSYSSRNNEGKPLERSQFIDESELPVREATGETDAENGLIVQVSAPKFQPYAEEDYIKENLLGNYRLSVSHLNKYLRCPVQFYYENILKIPFVANDNLILGNCIHHALEMLYKQARDSANISEAWLLQQFAVEFDHNKGQITPADYKRKYALGIILLQQYFKEYWPGSNKITTSEKHLRVNIQDVPCQYIADKIEFDGKKAILVDYKTGKVDHAKKELKPLSEKNNLGGDYWRQLVFGKLVIDELANQHLKPWQFAGARLFMLDKEHMGPLDYSITLFDEQEVRKQIRETYDKIMRLEFSQGCGECEYCKMQQE